MRETLLRELTRLAERAAVLRTAILLNAADRLEAAPEADIRAVLEAATAASRVLEEAGLRLQRALYPQAGL